MTAAQSEKKAILARKRVAKLIGYGCTEDKAFSTAAMTTGLSIADIRTAWQTR